MRLCFISNPNNTHTRRWVGWFARHGHSVCLVADVPLQKPWPEVPIFDLSKIYNAPIIRFPIWSVWLRRFLRQWHPDILHAHRVNSAGWVAAASGFHPLVITPWGTDLYQLGQQRHLARWLAHYTLRRADLITADAMDLLQLAEHYGANPACLRLVQWGVDLTYFHPGPPDFDLRTRLGLRAGPIILSPRATNPIYNLDIIIQAMPTVLGSSPEAMLILRDYNTEPIYKRRLEELITHLDLTKAVRWIGPIEPWEGVADIYRLADLAVSVPTSDSTPVSILEALACGIPVITTDLQALHEWLIPGESGLMVPLRDPQALAKAICQILADGNLADRFRKIGPTIVGTRANHQLEMQRMEDMYHQLAQSQRS
jgi:glycosyltransferase involved in cell wall biosynthesis